MKIKSIEVQMAEQCLHAHNYYDAIISKVGENGERGFKKLSKVEMLCIEKNQFGIKRDAIRFLQKFSPLSDALPSYIVPGLLAEVIYNKAPKKPETPFSLNLVIRQAEDTTEVPHLKKTAVGVLQVFCVTSNALAA